MKKLTQFLVVVTSGVAGLAAGVIVASAQVDIPTREVMKAKLQHSQAALEGIALADFDAVQASAQKLTQLSQAAGWRTRRTPEYDLFTAEFRRRTEALEQSAREKNIDGATLAYSQMTFTCVNCHKYIRGRKVVQLKAAVPEP